MVAAVVMVGDLLVNLDAVSRVSAGPPGTVLIRYKDGGIDEVDVDAEEGGELARAMKQIRDGVREWNRLT